jgi:hypothetical protein
MQEQLPTYGGLATETLDPDVRLSLECTIRSARAGGGAVSATELAELVEVGRSQALEGVPIEELLRAWRIGIEVSVMSARRLGSRLGTTDAEMVEFMTSVLAWSDVAMVETARGHRLAEIELARQDQERRASFVRGVLAGTMAPSEIRVHADSYGVDITRTYVALRARPAAGGSVRELERALGFDDVLLRHHGLSALVDGDLAGFTRQRPSREAPGFVGVGPPRSLDHLSESFRLATRALVTAESFELRGIQDIQGLGLRAAVAADWDVGDALCGRYTEPLAAVSSGREILESLRTLIACGMHVDRAAERLVIHPNTLRYRISRFEELTLCSLREPGTAFEVWWALERAEIRPNTSRINE